MILLHFPPADSLFSAEGEMESKECQTNGTFYNTHDKEKCLLLCLSLSALYYFQHKNWKWLLIFFFVVIGVYALEGFYPQSTRCFGENGVKIYTLKNKKVGVPHYKQGAGVWFYAFAKTREFPFFQDKNDACLINTFLKASNNSKLIAEQDTSYLSFPVSQNLTA